MSSEIFLSVIIPAYNEGKRIQRSLQEIVAYLRRQKYSSEIIVVDDGSQDQTVAIAQNCLKGFPHTILKSENNAGKGEAVRRGMLQGQGHYLLFSDADLSTPIEETEAFLKHLEKDYDVVIGSRSVKGSNVVKHQPFFREVMGKVFNLFARMLAFHHVHDSQCGFKGFSRRSARDLFSRQKLKRFSFDAEIVYLAQRLGYRLLEKPVIWRNSPQSRVSLWQDPLNMFMDLIKIRWLHRGELGDKRKV